MTKAPATAKDSTSIPMNFRILVPKNKKEIMITPATTVAFSDWINPTRLLIFTKIGKLPKMSITANNTAKQVPISFNETFAKKSPISLKFLQRYKAVFK